ncbi:hypothetical protein A9404_04010 [Halothiobacillus diazotrophicus]|uniref:Lipoprotein n=1 Tax=Halothiobacillus diazotrophicus TaxID=1860122 RepID=A0A191ZFM2_9GAMM|nr:hypothetical protein [Halothiobacillus diazotrophicus]ANJ66652.1 hypothetical protein A9404_04010 [Halothiobacillus diazotrophicus]
MHSSRIDRHTTNPLPHAPVFRALPVLLVTLALGGCATPEGYRPHPGFRWQPVGINAEGCTLYTKVATRPGTVVDAALWVRTPDGAHVLDPTACHGATGERPNNGRHDQ